jgi:hypothetical protein
MIPAHLIIKGYHCYTRCFLTTCCCCCCCCFLIASCLQEQRNILAIAVGLRGIAAIRAVLNWAPVQAHATSHKVSCFYVTKSPSSAAFLAEWDQWREAGVSELLKRMCKLCVPWG